MMSNNIFALSSKAPDINQTGVLKAHQLELEQLYNKNQLIPRIRKEFDKIEARRLMRECGIDEEFGLDLLVQMALHKRTSLPTMVGILRYHYNSSQKTADAILKACEADLCDWSPMRSELIVKYLISPEVQDEIDRYQFPLPMVIPPLVLKSNRETGYLTGKGSVILKKNHHDEDVCLDHINRMNSIRFNIDDDTAMVVKNKWRNMDKQKPGENKSDFDRRRRAFDKYDRTSKQVIKKLLTYGGDFYLTHRYDKRGRVYCQGYHVNYQGAPWNKAVIQLADKELVNG